MINLESNLIIEKIIKRKEWFSWKNEGEFGDTDSNPVDRWNSNGILGKFFYLNFIFQLFKKNNACTRSLRNFLALISLILPLSWRLYFLVPPPSYLFAGDNNTASSSLSLIFQPQNEVIWELKELAPPVVNTVVIIHNKKYSQTYSVDTF